MKTRVPRGTTVMSVTLLCMDQWDLRRGADRHPMNATYGSGLRLVFAPSHDPLPAQLERLVDRIEKIEADTKIGQRPSSVSLQGASE